MKKGLSPLIATVLIIAFVIILFALITTWVRRAAVEPAMTAGGEKVASELECAELDLSITKACVNTVDAPIQVKITVENTGNKNILKYKWRAIGPTGASTGESTTLDLKPLDRSAEVTYTISGTGKLSKVEVYPMTTIGICQGQLAIKTVIPAC